MRRVLQPSTWVFWVMVAYTVLGATVIVGQVQNADRVNEIERLIQQTRRLSHANRKLARAVCVSQNRSNELLSEAIRTVVLNQPHLNSLVIYSFANEIGKLRPVACGR